MSPTKQHHLVAATMGDPTAHDPTESVPVLIVGAGLSTAMFLGLHGVPALVIERHPGTSNQPKARGQVPAVMEALGAAGVADEIRSAGLDVTQPMEIVIGPSVLGQPFHRLLESFDFDIGSVTPARMAMTSQEAAEPILLARAQEFGARVEFCTELTGFVADNDGVTATILDRATGAERRIRADYLVGADGWRTQIRDKAGIGVHGHGELSHWVGTVFRADLDDVMAGREMVLVYLQNPELHGGAGSFIRTDEPGRWTLAFAFDPDSGERFSDFSEDDCVEQIRIGIGDRKLEVELIDRSEIEFAHRLADRFVAGRVILAGDAAHVMPPTGGQGGNTAVLDGFDLGWKLGMIVKGQAGTGLLDSYDIERRPYAEWVAEYQYQNLLKRMTPGGAEHSDGGPDVDPLDLMLGARVVDGAVCAEPGDDHRFVEHVATADGRPGSRAPHLWLDRRGEQVSTRELFGRSFVIITADRAWCEAAAEAGRRLGVPLDVQLIGADDLVDPSGRLLDRYGIGSVGASLVRPDGFVAWRTSGAADAGGLTTALRQVLSVDC